MDPYALGLLLGDGCITDSTTPTFATADPELADALEAALARHRAASARTTTTTSCAIVDGGRGGVLIANPVTARSASSAWPARDRRPSSCRTIYLLQLAPRSASPSSRDCSTPTAARSPSRPHLPRPVHDTLAPAPRRRRATWCGRWAASPTRARARPRAASRAAPTAGPSATATTRTSSTSGCPRASSRSGSPARRRCTTRRGGGRPMRFIDSIEPAGERETRVHPGRGRRTRSTSPTTSCVTHNTLNDAFIILDEAQNTSPEQMKMFLTRLGFGSKIVVTGDVTQVDLPGGTRAGCGSSQEILDGVEDMSLQPAHQPRRRPAPAGRATSSRRTTRTTAATGGATATRTGAPARRAARRRPRGRPVSIEVARRVRRPTSTSTRLARAAPLRARPAAGPPAGRAVASSWSTSDDHRPSSTSSGWTKPARPTSSPSRWTSCGPRLRQRGARGAALLGDLVLCPRGRRASRPRTRGPAGTRPPTSSTCSPCTASCTCSATTTPSPRSTRRCSACRPGCSPSGRRAQSGEGSGVDAPPADAVAARRRGRPRPARRAVLSADAALASVSRSAPRSSPREGRRGARGC